MMRTVLEVATYLFVLLFSAAMAIRFYPVIVHKMTAEQYYEGKDYFPLEDEMSDWRLMNPGPTKVEIIERDYDAEV